MFDRFFSSFKTSALIDEIKFDMNRSDKYSDRYGILCIERMYGLTSGYRLLEKKICRLGTMILVRSTKGVWEHLNGRED
jgi:hypothetical protein